MSNREPIRKPKRKNEFRLQRHKARARLLNCRLFSCDGQLLLFAGTPKARKLFSGLRKIYRSPSESDYWKKYVAQLGISHGSLGSSMLVNSAYSLDRWEGYLRERKRARGRKIQLREIQLLRLRLAFFQECFANVKRLPNCQFLLTPMQQESLKMFFSESETIHLPQATEVGKELVHIAYWHGAFSAVRFVEAMQTINSSTETTQAELEMCSRIESMSEWLASLKKRLATESGRTIQLEYRSNRHFGALVQQTKSVRAWQQNKGTLEQKLESSRCQLLEAKRAIEDWRNVLGPATIAAWAICDSAVGSLPKQYLQPKCSPGRTVSFLKQTLKFVSLSNRPNYETLLGLLRSMPNIKPSLRSLKRIERWIANGNSIADVKYVLERKQLKLLSANSGLAQFRKTEKLHEQLFPGETSFAHVHKFVNGTYGIEIISCVYQWLAKFPESARTDLNWQEVESLLTPLRNLDKNQPRPMMLPLVHEWAKLLFEQTSHSHGNHWESDFPKELRGWLRRLARYRRLQKGDVKLPKSLDRYLSFQKKISGELGYLKTLNENGRITEGARQRLNYLEEKGTNHSYDIDDLRIKTQACCLQTGLEVLQQILGAELRRKWQELAKCDVGDWNDRQTIGMLGWVDRMTGIESFVFRQIVEGWNRHGARFKEHLPFNQAWLRAARDRNLNLEHWLSGYETQIFISGEEFRIEVELDPRKTFMMGTHFRTCLAQDGCNEMSVLANASHANKQVVYVYDGEDKPVARKLVAIDSRWKLAGYRCYVHQRDGSEGFAKEMEAAIEQFCHDLAQAIRLELGNDGEPENVGNHFWYDDGTTNWTNGSKQE